MYNLIEYCKNHRKTTGSLWNYYRDKSNNPADNNYNAYPITYCESFKYKRGVTGKTAINGSTIEVEFVVPSKHLSDFWRTLNMPLINCEESLTFTWSENFFWLI